MRSLQSIQTSEKVKKDFIIKLLDKEGKTLLSDINKTDDNKVILDVSRIPNGTYYLHIIDGKETIKKQIIIKHN